MQRLVGELRPRGACARSRGAATRRSSAGLELGADQVVLGAGAHGGTRLRPRRPSPRRRAPRSARRARRCGSARPRRRVPRGRAGRAARSATGWSSSSCVASDSRPGVRDHQAVGPGGRSISPISAAVRRSASTSSARRRASARRSPSEIPRNLSNSSLPCVQRDVLSALRTCREAQTDVRGRTGFGARSSGIHRAEAPQPADPSDRRRGRLDPGGGRPVRRSPPCCSSATSCAARSTPRCASAPRTSPQLAVSAPAVLTDPGRAREPRVGPRRSWSR